MNLSQKCQYAVRAILELAKRYGQGPVTASEIASSQVIPQRFLEVILNELKPTGLIQSRRGVQGGYFLAGQPKGITIGQVIRLIDGPLEPVRCVGDHNKPSCPLRDRCALIELWTAARKAVEEVYDGTNFQDLVEREHQLDRRAAVDYCI